MHQESCDQVFLVQVLVWCLVQMGHREKVSSGEEACMKAGVTQQLGQQWEGHRLWSRLPTCIIWL